MYSLMLSGGTNVVIRAFNPEAVMQAIERHRVNEILLVPTMIQMLIDYRNVKRLPVCPAEERDLRRFADSARRCSIRCDEGVAGRDTFMQAYGMTESRAAGVRAPRLATTTAAACASWDVTRSAGQARVYSAKCASPTLTGARVAGGRRRRNQGASQGRGV